MAKKTPHPLKKNYWLIAGAGVGIFTVLTAYFNMNILVGGGDLSLAGSIIVIGEYTLLIYGLSLLKNHLN